MIALTADEYNEGWPCSCRWDEDHGGKQLIICRFHEAQEAKIKRLQKQVQKLKQQIGNFSMNTRSTLPQRRRSETFELKHGGQNTSFAVTFGFYSDGRVGEVFISGAKAGSEVEAVARDGAVLLSMALQYGVPFETIRHAITRNGDGSPSTIIGAVVDRLAKEDMQ
jgi:hypothetical protein